jgi:hypothetical protein
VSDRTLVLNIIRGLNENFQAIGLHLRRTDPLPTFLKVRAELQIEELTMAKTAPAIALLSSSGGGTGPPAARPPTTAPKPSHQPQQAPRRFPQARPPRRQEERGRQRLPQRRDQRRSFQPQHRRPERRALFSWGARLRLPLALLPEPLDRVHSYVARGQGTVPPSYAWNGPASARLTRRTIRSMGRPMGSPCSWGRHASSLGGQPPYRLGSAGPGCSIPDHAASATGFTQLVF